MEIEPIEPPKVAENVIDIDKIDLTLAFNRFLYLGSIQSNFIKPFVIDLKKEENNPVFTQIKLIINKLIETDPQAPLNLIKKAIQSKSLYAYDAALCSLVLCLCETKNEELQKEIRKNFTELVCTSEQLLLFIFFYAQMKKGKLNFARGMRIALGRWYKKKTANELVELFHTSRKINKIGHKNVMHMAHVKFDDLDRSIIVQSIYTLIPLTEDSTVIYKKIHAYRNLKSAKNAEKVIEILKAKEFPYKLEHIPTCALKSIEVIELILPSMTLREVLENILIFCSNRMLKVQDPVSKKICNVLQAPNKVISETKLHPIYIFQLIKELEKRLTIYHDLSATAHKNENGNAATENVAAPADDKAKTERKFSNPYIIKKMQNLFLQTLNEQPKTGCRFYVTVNFKKFSKRQAKVFGMNEVLCSELQAIIALALLKNEKEVSVMSFTDCNAQLKPVEWSSDMSYDKAMEIYTKEIKDMPKTKEVLQLPLRKAIEDKKKIDVFITFVSSLGRSLGDKGKPDHLISELQNYRRIMNLKMTKYIIINMTRKTPDLHYDDKNINEKGILEMVGFAGVSSMKVIEAFAKNCFA